eukprot:TRINITY_DN586_c0_g1_i5.p1 TRINITY_DN586_c0_g1~~TRINITY_DN586_c0_g1_i5.p1  ORF type:complete len:457 (-),score=184.06 TRINITY_DN586_c0_g1_i5:58-1428(-)
MVWILGEYSQEIEGADVMLEGFLDTFTEETTEVQLAFLTAALKMFLADPTEEGQDFVKQIMRIVLEESDNPDLRDRGYIYWRLLNYDSDLATEIILNEAPLINPQFDDLDQNLVMELIKNIPSLASVYHKPPEMISQTLRQLAEEEEFEDSEDEADDYVVDDESQNQGGTDYADDESEGDLVNMGSSSSSASGKDVLNQFLDDDDSSGNSSSGTQSFSHLIPKMTVLPANQGDGMAVAVSFHRRENVVEMEFKIGNGSNSPIGGFAVQFNKNIYQLNPAAPMQIGSNNAVAPGGSEEGTLPLNRNGQSAEGVNPVLQVAIKNNVKVYYFQTMVPFYVFLVAGEPLDRKSYVSEWKNIDDGDERGSDLKSMATTDLSALESLLAENNIYTVVKKPSNDGTTTFYMSATSEFGSTHFVELCVSATGGHHRIATRGDKREFADRFHSGMLWLLGASVAK